VVAEARVKGEGGVTPRGHQQAGRVHRLTLGEYPAVTLERARSLANTYLDQAKHGVNPIHALEGAATSRGLSIKALSDSFLEDYVRMRELRALAKYAGAIRVHIVPRLGEVNAELLTREHVRATLKHVMVPRARGAGTKDRPRGGKEAARTMLGVLRHMITWGMEEAKLKRKDNPVSGMEKNLPKKKKGERVLSPDEARTAWLAAGTLGYPFGPAFRLILLTGCRQGEWSRCTRSCIDLDEALLVLPSAAYKSDHVHVVPLVPEAVTILRHVLTNNPTESGEYIFSGTDGRRPLLG
jgi:integrase